MYSYKNHNRCNGMHFAPGNNLEIIRVVKNNRQINFCPRQQKLSCLIKLSFYDIEIMSI